MTFATDVAADIASIGGSTSITIYTVTEVTDAYGNSDYTYNGGTAATAIVSRVPHEELLKEFGETTGQYIKLHLPSTATVVEKDRISYDSNNWMVLKVIHTDYEGAITKKTVYARRELSV